MAGGPRPKNVHQKRALFGVVVLLLGRQVVVGKRQPAAQPIAGRPSRGTQVATPIA